MILIKILYDSNKLFYLISYKFDVLKNTIKYIFLFI